MVFRFKTYGPMFTKLFRFRIKIRLKFQNENNFWSISHYMFKKT